MKNVLRAGFYLILPAMLAACSAPTRTTLPDGTVALRIDCDGSSRGLNYCFERAGKSCGAEGYSIVDAQGRVISTSNAADDDAAALAKVFETEQNSILITCGT